MELIKVVAAAYVDGYRIHLTFSDGLRSTLDFEHLLWGEIFEPLKDLSSFQKFTLNPWTIEWENGADFAPEFLYDLSKQNSQEIKSTSGT